MKLLFQFLLALFIGAVTFIGLIGMTDNVVIAGIAALLVAFAFGTAASRDGRSE